MGQFNGMRVCGYRDGDAFKDVRRPTERDGKCPADTLPCNKNASPENMVCYPPGDLEVMCPITAIDIVKTRDLKSYEQRGYKAVMLEGERYVVYSKREDSLPITTIKIEAQPCASSWISSEAEGTVPLANEVLKDVTCQPDKGSGLTVDDRYTPVSKWAMNMA